MGNLCFAPKPVPMPQFNVHLPAGKAPVVKVIFAAEPELPDVPEVPTPAEMDTEGTEVPLSTLEDLDLVTVDHG